MRERPRSVRRDRSPYVLVLFGVLLVGVVVANRATRAEQPSETPTGEFFRQAPSDPGALQYSDLIDGTPLQLTDEEKRTGVIEFGRYQAASRETKASVDDAMAWAERKNGHSVSHAWSGYTNAMAQEAQVRRAEYEAGLAGIGDVGVVP
jgi:hypothetical protein